MGDLLAGGMLEQARQIRELMAERDALRAQVQRQAEALRQIAKGTPGYDEDGNVECVGDNPHSREIALHALDAAQAPETPTRADLLAWGQRVERMLRHCYARMGDFGEPVKDIMALSLEWERLAGGAPTQEGE